MQALHFTYGIGSFMAPLICEPFLSTQSIHGGGGGHGPPMSSSKQMNDHSLMLNGTSTTTIASMLLNNTNLNEMQIDPIDFLIYIPYAIAGAITIFSALIVLALYYYKKYEPPVDSRNSQLKQANMALENG